MGYTPGSALSGRRVDLGGIPLGGVDAAGVAWHLQDMEGWDSAEVRAEQQQREADHGAWPAPVYLSDRPITLTGKVEAPDLPALDDAMEQLRAAAALTDTVLVVHETVPKQATVRRSGKALIKPVSDRVAEYSLLLTAADPRRYATAEDQLSTGLPSTTGGLAPPLTPPLTISATTVSGQITATNAGTFETRPVITITGPVTAPQVLAQMPDGTVRALTYSQNLGTGEVLTIDTDAHSVTLAGGVSRRRYLTTPGGWPVIPARATVPFLFQSAVYDSGAQLTVRWRSAWL